MVGCLCSWVEIFFGKEVEFGVGTVVLHNDDSVALEVDGAPDDGSVALEVDGAPDNGSVDLEVDGALDAGVRVGTFLL